MKHIKTFESFEDSLAENHVELIHEPINEGMSEKFRLNSQGYEFLITSTGLGWTSIQVVKGSMTGSKSYEDQNYHDELAKEFIDKLSKTWPDFAKCLILDTSPRGNRIGILFVISPNDLGIILKQKLK